MDENTSSGSENLESSYSEVESKLKRFNITCLHYHTIYYLMHSPVLYYTQ